MKRDKQSGVTLVVSLIMLIVLTLLVVSAIRFGNINLKVANNAQVDAEAQAAAQIAIERMVAAVDDADKPDEVAAMANLSISTGGALYPVSVAKPSCILSSYVMSTSLDPSKASDRVCFGGGGADQIINSSGTIIAQPTECKSQNWEVVASLNDASSGANITLVQGLSARVSVEVQCP
ncbi:MAG TPA: PilX N-terminal domain-containing pilus assembly protein [Ramlibacter sp.]|nr:PilX N-terminal domain-containing pilus assembly protein [Ramlibacter sp.]